jgi:hypothetical protein
MTIGREVQAAEPWRGPDSEGLGTVAMASGHYRRMRTIPDS